MISFRNWKLNRTSAKALLYCVPEQKYLIVRSSLFGAGFFEPVGGGEKRGETGEQALVREMKEEIGVDLTKLQYKIQLLGKFDLPSKLFYIPFNQEVSLYHINVNEPVTVKPNWEIAEYKWVHPEDLGKYLNEYYKEAIETFKVS